MIHQPHFFPWPPYMARVVLSEIFVVLDDLSYRKVYYQNCTKLIDNNGNVKQYRSLQQAGLSIGKSRGYIYIVIKNKTKILDINGNEYSYELL
jgi:hypothetical protein